MKTKKTNQESTNSTQKNVEQKNRQCLRSNDQ